MSMRWVSAFAGIGGFDVAIEAEGMEVTDQIEINAHCQLILRKHFPKAHLMGDITDVRAHDLSNDVDGAVGGFPCQDTSIAAPHRAGLAGKRSGHFYQFTRLLDEYARCIDITRPRWVVIENPVGLLRSNDGRDMLTVVRTLAELGYVGSARVLDARDHGSPQRRQRVIVVGHRGTDPTPVELVLGDRGPGAHARGARRLSGGTIGPVPSPTAAYDGVWRKSARARAALSKGGYETWVSDGDANTLTGFDYGGPKRQTHLIAQDGRLRTATLREWERLQGFPDDWTVGIPESARGTGIGNAMHVGMARWVMSGIRETHHALPLIGATR